METTSPTQAGPPPAHTTPTRGSRIDATGLTVVHGNGAVGLDDITLTVEPGRLTAVIGPSGAGKSTLIKALAGLVPIHEGTVSLAAGEPGAAGSRLGFVPQDDILHSELPLRRTLRYSARLRMTGSGVVLDAAVDDAMELLGLTPYADQPVRSLSGGQRKRASIATEILTRPGVCVLDEPTSGLDPATAADLVRHLHRMCAEGSTVVFTTHSVEDIRHSDSVVVLAPGGRVLATGTPEEVLGQLDASTFAQLYARVGEVTSDEPPVTRPRAVSKPRSASSWASATRGHGPGAVRQWAVLTRRSAELLTHNRLTLAILLGSPAAVISMFAILFRAHGFVPGSDPTAAVQVVYWLSFAGFFFGLTFGLLQVATEVPVLSRERHAGMRIGAYLMSKIGLLLPVLLLVNAVMLVVLRALDRIPSLSPATAMELYVTMGLNALAALCLGLLASAAVGSTAQAALALPMLCFPAVLFAGAMVPLPVMADAGRVIAAAMSDRWAFEAIARSLDVGVLAGPVSPYRDLGGWPMTGYWALLAAFAAGFGGLAYVAVRRRARG